MRAIASLGETEAVYAAVADAYSLFGAHGEAERAIRREKALSALKAGAAPDHLRFGGRASFGAYDPVRGVLPITRSYVQVSGFDTIALGFNFRPEFFPAFSEVAVTPEQAAAITAAAQTYSELEIRIDAAMVEGAYAPPQAEYLDVQATLTPKTIEIFSGRGQAISAERRLLARVVLPEAPAGSELFDSLRIDK